MGTLVTEDIQSAHGSGASPRTARQWMDWAEARFRQAGLCFGHGTDNAWDEAVYLVLHALGLPASGQGLDADRALSASERASVLALVEERIRTRRPAAYLTREAWFAGLRFYVDERVLVPRSPIAELIGEAFAPWIQTPCIARILDLGTGSGCIGIACAHAFPQARVDVTDISPEALAVARKNIVAHGLRGRVAAIHCDLYQGLSAKRYDIIVSNPPYVGAQQMAALPAEYHHEPGIALAAGTDGLEQVMPILEGAAGHLMPGGMLVVEVGDAAQALMARCPQVPFLWLEFERGGHGVFLLSAEQCAEHFPVGSEG
jgi:ribosomal protein L3 glutamine methyltransferase